MTDSTAKGAYESTGGEGEGSSGGRSWRRIFEEDLHPLDTDTRLRLAGDATDDALLALCFDPAPNVIRALFKNPHVGLQHARLIAEHHRSSVGLDALGDQAQFLRDTQVQRLLYRNPQLSERLLRRLYQTKRMADMYRLSIGRDSTERVRSLSRKEFRKKFASGSAEERVSLIVKCEGRCLILLIGVPLDGKAAAFLCSRPLHSTLLIQNLCRWPSTPPNVLQHLARQPLVVRNPSLRTLIQRHPNCPSQIKNAKTLR